jgi:intracellular sulfur oxidation DsrE/DsrF family protein
VSVHEQPSLAPYRILESTVPSRDGELPRRTAAQHEEGFMEDALSPGTPRRGFLGQVAAAAVGLGATGLLPAAAAAEAAISTVRDPALDAWFGRFLGKHRAVFDGSEPNGGMPAIWPRIYINTTMASYPGEATNAMVILRHGGLGMAFQDAVWAKYPISEMFKMADGVPLKKNPYASITGLPIPGLGIAELLKSGVLVGACDVAITVYSTRAATTMKLDPAAVKKEWVAGLLPGIQVVPSGVMAVARAQELGASYIFAG